MKSVRLEIDDSFAFISQRDGPIMNKRGMIYVLSRIGTINIDIWPIIRVVWRGWSDGVSIDKGYEDVLRNEITGQ